MTVPPPPWRSEPPRRAAKPVLSQDLIVKTALEILVAEGVDAVSMRRVAQALDTGPASLYAHVANKDELQELMVDRALDLGPLPEPDPAQWLEQVKQLLRQQVQALMTYPGIAKIAWNVVVPVGENALHQGEAMLKLMRAGGLSLRQAAFAGDALWLYTKAYAYEASGWASGEFDEAEVAERGRQMTEYMQSLPPTAFPNMLQMGELFNAETAAERFEFALDMFLGGLKTLAGG